METYNRGLRLTVPSSAGHFLLKKFSSSHLFLSKLIAEIRQKNHNLRDGREGDLAKKLCAMLWGIDQLSLLFSASVSISLFNDSSGKVVIHNSFSVMDQ